MFEELAYLDDNPVRPFVWSPRSTTMPDIWVGPVETAAHLKEKWFIAFSQSAAAQGSESNSTVKVRARRPAKVAG